MKFLLSIFLFSTFLTLAFSFPIYVDPTSQCTSDCGSVTNPFPTLPLALFVFDQIFENNQSTRANYPNLTSNFIVNSSVVFYLQSGSYSFDFMDIQRVTRPCNASIEECIFSYFLHSRNWNGPIWFWAPYTSTLNINTQRVKFYGNFSMSLNFYNIIFNANFSQNYDYDLSGLGLYLGPHSLFSLWLSTTDYAAGFILNFTNCVIQNFQQNNRLVHNYSHFIGFDGSLSQQTINSIFYVVMYNNTFVNNSFMSDSFIDLKNTELFISQSFIVNFGSFPFLKIQYVLVQFDHSIFYNTSTIIVLAENCSITFNAVNIYNSYFSSYNGYMIYLNKNVYFNISNVSVSKGIIGSFLYAGYQNDLYIMNLYLSYLQSSADLFIIDTSNQASFNNVSIFSLVSDYRIFFIIMNNNLNFTNMWFSMINSFSTYTFRSLFYLSNNNNSLAVTGLSIYNLSNFISVYEISSTNNYLTIVNNVLNSAYFNIFYSIHGIFLNNYGAYNQINLKSIQISSLNHGYPYYQYSFFQCNYSCLLNLNNITIDQYFTGFEYVVFLESNSNNSFVNISSLTLNHLFTSDRIIYNQYNHSSLKSTQNLITASQLQSYYVNYTDYFIYPCGSNCIQCVNYTYCYSCGVNTYNSYGQCWPCGSGYFYNNNYGYCQSCGSNCSSCSNDYSCDSCSTGYSYYNYTCLNVNCSRGYYFDYTYLYCQSCIQNCVSCSNSYSCDVCSSGYANNYYNCQYNYNICGTGYFYNYTNGSCQQCIANCTNCSNSYSCDVCSYGYSNNYYNCQYNNSNSVCTTKGYFYNNTYGYCQSCIPNCVSCSNSYGCDICSIGYTNNYYSCQYNSDYCGTGYFLNNTYSYGYCESCQKYITNCVACSNSYTCDVCSSGYTNNYYNCQYNYYDNYCRTGYFYNYTIGSCQHCIANCTICSNSYTCDVCSSGYSNNYYNCQYNNSYNICSTKGYFYNNTYGYCQPCISNCASCSNSYGCDICSVGYTNNYYSCQYNSNYCGNGFFFNTAYGYCQSCINNCASCSNNYSCDSCSIGYNNNYYNCQYNYNNCGTGYFYNNTAGYCQNCISNCANCTNSSSCVVCSYGYTNNYYYCQYDPSNSICPIGYFYNTTYGYGFCQSCINNCSYCSNSYSCICNSGYFYNYYGYCQKCISGCSQCSNYYTCNACFSGYSNNYYSCYISNCSIYNGDYGCQQCNDSYYLVSPYYCASCQIPGCLSCSNGTNGLICYNCSSGYYLISYNNNNSIVSTCLSCKTSLSNCASCHNNSYCDYCDIGYLSVNGICSTCDHFFPHCDICNNYYCSSCSSGYYLNDNNCIANRFALNFPNGIVGQFYNFYSQQCLSVGYLWSYSSLYYNYNNRNMTVPCNGNIDYNTLFMIKQVYPNTYTIQPFIQNNFLLSADCKFSYMDYRSHFSLSVSSNYVNTTNYTTSNYTNSSSNTTTNVPVNNNTNYTTSNYTNSSSNETYNVSTNNTNTSSNTNTTNSSVSTNSTNSSICPALSNYSCEYYSDSYNFDSCFANNQQTSFWNLEMINNPNAFGDSKSAFVLKNVGLNNLCLSNSDDGLLKPCNSNDFDFMFGFKIIYINYIENRILSSIRGYQDTVSIMWTDPMNNSNISYIISYFNDSLSFYNYTCGSDKSNSPVSFNSTYDLSGSHIVSVNLSLNDMVNCGALIYEDSTYMYFDLKASTYDKSNKLIFDDFYHIKFMKLSSYGKVLYVGYTNDSSNSDDQILENNSSTITLNVSTFLNVNINNLISNKYLKKNITQTIHVTYSSNNRFKMNLLNGVVDFVLTDLNKGNKTYYINATSNNSNSNEIMISFELSSLTSGYYTLQFDIFFEMMKRILAENSAEPTNFTSTYVAALDIYIGTNSEVEEKIKEDSINASNSNKSNDDGPDVKIIIIAVLISFIGVVFLLIPAIYFMKKYRKKKNEKKYRNNNEEIKVIIAAEDERLNSANNANVIPQDKIPERLIAKMDINNIIVKQN